MYTLFIHKEGKVFQYGQDRRDWDQVEKDIKFLTLSGRYTHEQLEAKLEEVQ